MSLKITIMCVFKKKMNVVFSCFAGGFMQGPPESVVEYCAFQHKCEGDLVCKVTHANPPQFNAAIFYEDKTQVRNY